MPGFNQSGPDGRGPMTGRRLGRCTNFGANIKNQIVETNKKNNENIMGRGLGIGRIKGGGCYRRRHQNRFRGEL